MITRPITSIIDKESDRHLCECVFDVITMPAVNKQPEFCTFFVIEVEIVFFILIFLFFVGQFPYRFDLQKILMRTFCVSVSLFLMRRLLIIVFL